MAENGVTLTFSPANTITVVLMVVLSFAIIGVVVKIWQQKKAS